MDQSRKDDLWPEDRHRNESVAMSDWRNPNYALAAAATSITSPYKGKPAPQIKPACIAQGEAARATILALEAKAKAAKLTPEAK